MVQVDRFLGGHNHEFLGVGVLITRFHVLTPRSIYNDFVRPFDIVFRIGGPRLGEGRPEVPIEMILHDTADLAIGKLRHNEHMYMSRNRNGLRANGLCTMIGYDVSFTGVHQRSLVMHPITVRSGNECGTGNLPAPFCIVGIPNQFPDCGGFVGGSIQCEGYLVTGFGVVDQMCMANSPRLFVISLHEHDAWINYHTGGVKGLRSGLAIIGVILSVLLSKIVI